LKLTDLYNTNSRRAYTLLFLYIISCLFIHNWSISIWDQDEGAYALFAKNMINTGNWLVPDAMWSDIHRKPPFHFWTVAISYKLFGMNEFALRLPSSLFTLCTYLLVLWGGGKLFDKTKAFYTTLILCTSLLVSVLAKIAFVDATLLFFITVCAFGILFVLLERSKVGVFIFWLSFAIALLVKGPPVIIFTGIFSVILFIFHPLRKNLLLLHPWFFLPLALIPFAYWCYHTYLLDGGKFLNWMYDWYVLKRISGSVLGQTGPPGTHLLIIIICFFPFLALIPSAFANTVRNFLKDKNQTFILGAWFFSTWFIYELSPSKLPTYVLAAHIPFAFMIANRLLDTKIPLRSSLILHYAFQCIIAIVLMGTAIYLTIDNQIKIIVFISGLILLIATLISIFLKKSHYFFLTTLAYAMLFQVLTFFVLLPQIDEFKNTSKKIGMHFTQFYSNEYKVLIGNSKWTPPSLPFYIGMTSEKISEESDFATLLSNYCDTNKYVFVLNEKQAQLFYSIVGDIQYSQFTNQSINIDLKNTYYVVSNIESFTNSKYEEIKVQSVTKLADIKSHEEGLRKSPEQLLVIQKKAIANGISLDEMIKKDAIWLYENEKRIHTYDASMRQKQKWLSYMKQQSLKLNISLEEACHKYAEIVISAGKVN
jgi:4-amino-4-deoxy-L-arabinose transferase-like glycosyltransferase